MNLQCFPGSSRYANTRWIISPSQSPGSRNASLHGHTQWTCTTCCPDTSASVWKSILLGGRLHDGEQKNLLDNANSTGAFVKNVIELHCSEHSAQHQCARACNFSFSALTLTSLKEFLSKGRNRLTELEKTSRVKACISILQSAHKLPCRYKEML